MNNENSIAPYDEPVTAQHAGGRSDNCYSATAGSVEEARTWFQSAVNRLQQVNEWSSLCGTGSANFQLTDAKGNPVERALQKNDYLRIDIPGPGSKTGDGYDWAVVESIKVAGNENTVAEFVTVTVRPAPQPGKSEDTAHFFKEAATSTFIVRRHERDVIAEICGRNEWANTDTGNMLDKARNLLVAGAAAAFFSDMQWKQLVKGIMTGRA